MNPQGMNPQAERPGQAPAAPDTPQVDEAHPPATPPGSRGPLVVVTGPTGVGKTGLSLQLAARFQGEIINADSRQIYRGLDIATAKPTPQERARIPHHLFDIREPDTPLTLAEYQRLAYAAIDAVHARGHLPLLVGGTPLYIQAVVQGLRIPPVPPNPELRRRLEAQAREEGPEVLHHTLARLDPESARRIDPRNVRRVVRALEIVLTTGRPKSALEGHRPPPYRILRIGLTMPREALYARIDRRVWRMVQAGLLQEAARLLERYALDLPAMTGLGYREIAAHLRGEISLEEAVRRIQAQTHRYVRHQSSWFRRMADVEWYEWDPPQVEAVVRRIQRWLQEGGSGDSG